MALAFKVGENSDMPPVPKNFPTCGNFIPADDYLIGVEQDKCDHIKKNFTFFQSIWKHFYTIDDCKTSSTSAASTNYFNYILIILSIIFTIKR